MVVDGASSRTIAGAVAGAVAGAIAGSVVGTHGAVAGVVTGVLLWPHGAAGATRHGGVWLKVCGSSLPNTCISAFQR